MRARRVEVVRFTRCAESLAADCMLPEMADGSTAGRLVSPAESERLRSELEHAAGDAQAGFFGPGSATWRVSRESAVFLGAGRAALLQLAHPWVAAALIHHSNLMHDAIGRFHSTFRVIYTMLFGSRAQALAASRQVYALHTGIHGALPEQVGAHPRGEHYEANETSALRWVHSTLVDSAVLAYEFAVRPLPAAEREQYYGESKRMAALFGLSGQALPADWKDFSSYVAATLQSPELGVDTHARALAQGVLSGVGTWVRPPRWYHALTASWLPPHLRHGFSLPFGPAEQRSVRNASRWFPAAYRSLPSAIRYVGPYREAQTRLRGAQPGLLTRQSNRFWMGVPRLLYPQHAGLTRYRRSGSS